MFFEIKNTFFVIIYANWKNWCLWITFLHCKIKIYGV